MRHQRYILELPPDHEVPVEGMWPDGWVLRSEQRPDPALCRALYLDVGREYHWVDRADWTDHQWFTHLLHPRRRFFILWALTEPAGFFELKRDDDAGTEVEVAYFGLKPSFHGQGFGKRLLACAVHEARALGGRRVWLHTNTRDHPHALANYRARGFRVTAVEDL
ncbi:MAG: GNAT family N-acetyltransferase [Vicinamibacterales bacterium]